MGNGKAEARSFDTAVLILIQPLEIIEQLFLVCFLDADAGVVDDEREIDVVFLPALVEHIEIDLAHRRVFDRVCQEVDDDLLDAHHIAHQYIRQILVDMERKVQSLFLGLGADHRHGVFQEPGKLILAFDDFQFSRFYFREVENIVDDG